MILKFCLKGCLISLYLEVSKLRLYTQTHTQSNWRILTATCLYFVKYFSESFSTPEKKAKAIFDGIKTKKKKKSMKIKNDFLHKLETLNKKKKKTDKNMFKISFNILYNFSLKKNKQKWFISKYWLSFHLQFRNFWMEWFSLRAINRAKNLLYVREATIQNFSTRWNVWNFHARPSVKRMVSTVHLTTVQTVRSRVIYF